MRGYHGTFWGCIVFCNLLFLFYNMSPISFHVIKCSSLNNLKFLWRSSNIILPINMSTSTWVPGFMYSHIYMYMKVHPRRWSKDNIYVHILEAITFTCVNSSDVTTLWGRAYCPPFINEETKAQKDAKVAKVTLWLQRVLELQTTTLPFRTPLRFHSPRG